MPRIHVIRHGECTATRDNIWSGSGLDVRLTETGEQQAVDLIPVVGRLGVTKLVSSPLKRARRTAEIIGGGIKIRPDEILKRHFFIAQNLGELTGTPHTQLVPPPDTPGLEPTTMMRDRVAEGLVWLGSLPDSNVGLVTHSFVHKMIVTILEGRDLAQTQAIPALGNTKIYSFDLPPR